MLFAGREVRFGKNCARGLEYSRPRAHFFPIRTDLGRQITCLFFSSVEYFVSSFCVEFSVQPVSNLVYACVWHLGNGKSTLRSFAFLCFSGHYLHFTFFAVKKKTAGKDAKAGKLVAVRTLGPDGKIRTVGARAISQSDSRIPDRSDAWENKKYIAWIDWLFFLLVPFICGLPISVTFILVVSRA